MEIEEVPDQDAIPANMSPRNENRILEHIDDDEDNDEHPGPQQKKARSAAAQKRNRVFSDDEGQSDPSASRPLKRLNAGESAETMGLEEDGRQGKDKETEGDGEEEDEDEDEEEPKKKGASIVQSNI